MDRDPTIFKTTGGIHAEFYKNNNSESIAVICHGLLCTTRSRLMRELKDLLMTTFNYSVCLFDFRGNGKSEGTTGYGNYLEETEDLSNVVQYLQKAYGQVDLIAGHSKAASVVLMYAHLEGYMGTLWMLSGRFDMSVQPSTRFTEDQLKQLEKEGKFIWKTYKRNDAECDYVVFKDDIDRRVNMKMSDYCKVKCKSVIIVHGTEDTVVPCEDGRSYQKMIENSRLYILDGVDHFYIDNALSQLTMKLTGDLPAMTVRGHN